MRLNLAIDKLRRHQAFLDRAPTDRPLIGSWLFGFYVPELYPRVAATLPVGEITPKDIQVEPFLEDIDAVHRAYTELDDDFPFAAGALPSVPWMEAMLGCPIHFSGTTMWAEPCITRWDDYHWNPRSLDNPWAVKLLELLEALVRHADGRFPCTPTLMRGVADMCAAARGSTVMPLDLFDCPDRIDRLAERCATALIDVGKAQLAIIPPSENGYIAGCAGLRCWFPEKGIWLQDDAVSILSPALYRKHFVPQVRRVAGEFDQVAFHLHGNQMWPVSMLLELDEIDVLDLNYDAGASLLDEKMIPAWRGIQAKKPCIVLGHFTLEEFARICQLLSPTGLSLQIVAPTLADGRKARAVIYA